MTWYHPPARQFSRAWHHSKRRHRWVGVKGSTLIGRHDPKCPPAKRLRMVREDTEGKKHFNDDFVQSIPRFQECDEDVETPGWHADAEDCGFQMLNDDKIVTSVQEESDPVDNEMDEDEDNNNESSKGPSNANAFVVLETDMEWYGQQ
ncbi:uncharacterized protein TNCV_4182211 [Trichonephila clavipes]|nr:uncharacterized protein TNCV_4182211 [Trichonephila clavipes]